MASIELAVPDLPQKFAQRKNERRRLTKGLALDAEHHPHHMRVLHCVRNSLLPGEQNDRENEDNEETDGWKYYRGLVLILV